MSLVIHTLDGTRDDTPQATGPGVFGVSGLAEDNDKTLTFGAPTASNQTP